MLKSNLIILSLLIKGAIKHHTYGGYNNTKEDFFKINIELSLNEKHLSLNYPKSAR